jgi:hypothetical protein
MFAYFEPLNVSQCGRRSCDPNCRSIPRLRENPKKPLANQFCRDSSPGTICAGFLDPESRRDLIDLGRDGSVAHRLGRRGVCRRYGGSTAR